jgi:hypothetical protein
MVSCLSEVLKFEKNEFKKFFFEKKRNPKPLLPLPLSPFSPPSPLLLFLFPARSEAGRRPLSPANARTGGPQGPARPSAGTARPSPFLFAPGR